MKDHSYNSCSVSDHPLQRFDFRTAASANPAYIAVPKGAGTVRCDPTRLNTVSPFSLRSAEC